MQQSMIMKGAIFALFLFLTSCSKSSHQWICEKTLTHDPCYDSMRIILPSRNHFRELELELTQGAYCKMYINVFSIELPEDPDCPNKTKVSLSVDGNSKIVYADRLKGGQRLLLPPDTTQMIIDSLLEGKPLSLSVSRYKAEIIPDRFSNFYQALEKMKS